MFKIVGIKGKTLGIESLKLIYLRNCICDLIIIRILMLQKHISVPG